jgi:exonuclease SbcC
MSYTINQLKVRNFKCFDNKKFYTFQFEKGRNPAILSGPNGFGKTTFFDAIELIFTKKITRMQIGIEDKRINLGKNILLNEANKDGNLILTLTDENDNYLTIITIIDNQIQKLLIEESIKYNIFNGKFNSDDDIDKYIIRTENWESSLETFNKIKYYKEYYNVYYYISQSESVHFLKNSINQRKDSMNILLKTNKIQEYIENISDNIIGKNATKKGVVINDAISSCKEIVNRKIQILKSKIQDDKLKLLKIEYSQLLSYPPNVKPASWDIETPIPNVGDFTVESIIEIEALYHFALNISDYNKYLHNEEINKIVNNETIINDFIYYHNYLENGVINKKRIIDQIEEWNKLTDIYNCSEFFRKGLDIKYYKENDLYKLKEINSDFISVDIKEITNIVTSINKAINKLSEKQNVLYEFKNARTKLYQIKNQLNKNSSNCPYCNHKYNDIKDLENAFLSFSNVLGKDQSEESQYIQALSELLKNKLQKDNKTILKIVQNYDDQKISELNILISKNQQFVENENRMKYVKTISNYIYSTNSIVNLENYLDINRILQANLKSYNNPNFINDMYKYNFPRTLEKYKNIFSISQSKLIQKDEVENKIKYLQYVEELSRSSEINALKSEIKKELYKLQKLNLIRNNFEKLQKLYSSSIDEYKNQILKKLRVPLLIYTGKILQDYQNGLGVFVSKDEMRFVSNGDVKHDILNTFSSGQLSGFVLAFLFSMNKQYVMKSTDDIGFILVDDPVQTMDDINISSLIEVLRNDFSNKQIIISTHESDKENYILYKFLKYDLRGQSFNVKDNLYV